MGKVADIRTLMVIFRQIAPALNDDEIAAIAAVIYKALDRLEKEAINEC